MKQMNEFLMGCFITFLLLPFIIQTIVAGCISYIHFVKFVSYQMLISSVKNNNQMQSLAKKREKQHRRRQKREHEDFFLHKRNDQKAYNLRLQKSPTPKDESHKFKQNDKQLQVNYDEVKGQKIEQVQQHKIHDEQSEQKNERQDELLDEQIHRQEIQRQSEFYESFESRLQDEIHNIMEKYFDQSDITSVREAKEIMGTFRNILANSNNNVNLKNLFQCYEQCLALKNRYFGNKKQKDRTIQQQNACIEWNHIFQQAFLLILKRKTVENTCFQSYLQRHFENHLQTLIKYIDNPLEQMDRCSFEQFNERLRNAVIESLKAIQSLCQMKRIQGSQKLLQKILTYSGIKRLVSLISDPWLRIQATVLITHIFFLIAKGRFSEVLQYILKNKYCQVMRDVIDFEIDFHPPQINELVEQQEKIVKNVLSFLNQSCSKRQINDFLWDTGIFIKIREALQSGVTNYNLKIEMTCTIYKSIPFIQKAKAFTLKMNSHFDWAFDTCVFCINNRESLTNKEKNNEVLLLSIGVLTYFLQSKQHLYYSNKIMNKNGHIILQNCAECQKILNILNVK